MNYTTDLPHRQCERCQALFSPRYHWAKLCYPCWKAENPQKVRDKHIVAQLLEENRRLRGLLDNRLDTDTRPDDWQLMIKRLLRLTHPDRWHGTPQEQTANDVTKWLLAEKSRLQ